MTNIGSYTPAAFDYDLPQDRIAQYPLEDRSSSKLLHYVNGAIHHRRFTELPGLISPGTLLIFNDTRVIPARTFFTKETGAVIQIFLLEARAMDIQQAMSATGRVDWECMIGNLKKWKDHETLTTKIPVNGQVTEIQATLLDREKQIVQFAWDGGQSFSHVIRALGHIPLPPYIKRESEAIDLEHYQTVYAHTEGAVAAPTAGLHFTKEVLRDLREKNVDTAYLTLHVGAGTFQPLQAENVMDHDMHSEHFEVDKKVIRSLADHPARIAVGTTSLRTLESLYWAGVRISRNEDPRHIEKDYPYNLPAVLTYEESLHNLLAWLAEQNLPAFRGSTAIMIIPGYRIRSIHGLVTNFHLPKSTLIMLVAALIGDDWKRVYRDALDNRYRFLSYGDSSLLLP